MSIIINKYNPDQLLLKIKKRLGAKLEYKKRWKIEKNSFFYLKKVVKIKTSEKYYFFSKVKERTLLFELRREEAEKIEKIDKKDNEYSILHGIFVGDLMAILKRDNIDSYIIM